MLIPCGARKFALINRFGKVEKTYNIGKNYSIHHDFFLQESTDRVFVLVDDLSKDTKEDVIACLDLYTGKTKKLLDMQDLLPDMYKKAKKEQEKESAKLASGSAVSGTAVTAGAEKLDWLHLNSVYMINETDADLLLTKDGDFMSQFGQHSAVYEKDPLLEDGQYYIYLFNNNYGESKTRPDINWGSYSGIGLPGMPATNSYYYKYLVDDKADTYKLVFQISLSYSPLFSNAMHYDGNIITSAGSYGTFAEYNADGKPVGRFVTQVKNFNYRVKKYDMEGYWFSDLWNGKD